MGRKKVQPQATAEHTATAISSISIDLGNAYSSVRADGGIDADWRSVQARLGTSSQMTAPPFDSTIKLQNEWYVFGAAAYTYATQIEDYTTTDRYTTPWYKRLFAFALHKAYGLRVSESPFYPRVVASIPAKEYANDARVALVKDNLVGGYVIGNILDGDALQVVIDPENLTIIPEGLGAYYSMLSTADNGGLSVYSSGQWAVLDLGYLTADLVMFRDGNYMPEKSTSDANYGMQEIAATVAKYVRGQGGADMPPEYYDGQLACDSVTVSGKTYAIKAARDTALAALGEGLGRFVAKAARGQSLSGLLLAGGGAEFFRDKIKVAGMPPVITIPNARRANVNGAFGLITEG